MLRPPAFPLPRRRACWLLLAAAAASLAAASPTHAYQPCPADAIDENSHPQVQCNRDPPCVRFTYLSKEKCRGELRLDSGWPTYDAHVPREAGWATAADLLAAHARNKTVLIVGDSVTHGEQRSRRPSNAPPHLGCQAGTPASSASACARG
jgi:hypothetical protein